MGTKFDMAQTAQLAEKATSATQATSKGTSGRTGRALSFFCALQGGTRNADLPQRSSMERNLRQNCWCKHDTAPRTLHTRKHFLACGSRGAHSRFAARIILLSFMKNSHLHGHIFRSHARCAWPDRIPLPPSHSIPQHRVQFGRLAEQSSTTGHEPNGPVEVSSTEVTTTLLPTRRASIGSTCNSGEDFATTHASSEVDSHRRERQTPTEKILCQIHHTIQPVQGNLWRGTHTRESQVEIQQVHKSLIPKEKGSSLSKEKFAMFLNCEQIMPPKENKQLHKNSEAEYHTRLLLEEHKNHILSV